MALTNTEIASLYSLDITADETSSDHQKTTEECMKMPSDPILAQNVTKCDLCTFAGNTGTVCPYHPSSNPGDCEHNVRKIKQRKAEKRQQKIQQREGVIM